MPDYILEPLDTDPQIIFEDFVEYVQGYFPDWNPSDGQLDIVIARFFSVQCAFTADMASRVQRAIYRYFGSSLANIPPLPGTPASMTVSFIVGAAYQGDPHQLDSGTMVGVSDSNDDMQFFALLGDMVVVAGTANPTAEAQAIELGIAGNELSGTVQLTELVDWIESATVVGESSGGSDPEEDDIYIQRLTDNLMIPRRPALAPDFALVSTNVPGVWRTVVKDNYDPGPPIVSNAADTITITSVDQAGVQVSSTIQTDELAYLRSLVRQNFVIKWQNVTYDSVQVTIVATALVGADIASVQTTVRNAVLSYLSKATYGAPPNSPQSRAWLPTPTLRYLELTTVAENTPGVDFVSSLTFGLNGGAQSAADKNFTGLFTLPDPVTVNVTINTAA